MLKKLFLFLIAFVSLCSIKVQAQNLSLSGKLLNAEDKSPLIGATVRLIDMSDTTRGIYTSSAENGQFKFINLSPMDYKLIITFIGFKKLVRKGSMNNLTEDLGILYLSPSTEVMKEVKVVGRVPAAQQKGDTTLFNAQAYKTNSDASAGDLILKMPGITVDNGSISAQGETVQQVLVDGKPFFGNDPSIALDNLPANIISKVEVYEKESDQAKFTGFDDGQSQKVINFITKRSKRHSDFGRINAGYGTSRRNSESGNLNIFDGNRRISIIGLSNNVNKQNFSTQDILGAISNSRQRRFGGFGGGMRMGGGRRGGGRSFGRFRQMNNFLVGQQNGISSTHSIGVNYNDDWAKKFVVNGSYFFNMSHNNDNQALNRTYFMNNSNNQFYNENNISNSDNFNNRVNMRIIYRINPHNSIIFRPNLSFQKFTSGNNVSGLTYSSPTDSLSKTTNNYSSDNSGYNLRNDLLLRHAFAKRGRTFSVNLNTEFHKNDALNYLNAYSTYFQQMAGTPADTTNQRPITRSNGYDLSSNMIYTEPISRNSQLEIRYDISYNRNKSDKNTFNYDQLVQAYSLMDTTLSNNFNNNYLTNSGGIAYRIRSFRFFLTLGINYETANLINNQIYPYSFRLTKSFHTFLPNAMLRYRFSRSTNIRIFYRTNTSIPSVNQLQNVTDNTNPLLLSTGNSNLKQETNHVLISRFSHVNMNRSNSFFALFYITKTQNYIGNNTIIATHDTTLSNGTVLNQGSQMTSPMNLSGYWNFRTFLTYGFPLRFIRSNLNLNTGFNYIRTPGIINGVTNISNSFNYSQGLVIGSNISKNVDFRVSYTANYNLTKNAIQPDLNNHYFYQIASVNFVWTIWHGIVISNDLTQQLYSGLAGANNQDYFLWNAAIGKKLFKNHRGEISLSAYDLLNQNNSISRTITNTYIEDQNNETLHRYFLLTLTYKI